MFSLALKKRAQETLTKARKKKLTIATAESCTGGLIAACLTEIAGSSDVVDRGFVTYSNRAKRDVLGVSKKMLDKHGAVSKQVAIAMVKGALKHSRAKLAVSCTGIAGPGGGSNEKPVGLVHIAVARKRKKPVHLEFRFGDLGRAKVRLATVEAALELLIGQM